MINRKDAARPSVGDVGAAARLSEAVAAEVIAGATVAALSAAVRARVERLGDGPATRPAATADLGASRL